MSMSTTMPDVYKRQVLVKELQSLCLDMKVLDENGAEIELKDDDEDNYQPDRIRDDDDFYSYRDGDTESDFAAAGFTLKAESDDDDLAANDADESAADEDDAFLDDQDM